MLKKINKLVILGSGPAGYTSAIYAARANLNPVIITGLQKGGQLMNTTDVDNWPGEKNGIQGPELMDNLQAQAERFNTEIIQDTITEVSLKTSPFLLKGNENYYECDALIIATGASSKSLNLSSEKKFIGKGVSYCATCDGYFYKNKNVAVIGGGNTAVEEVIFLSKIAKSITLIHRSESLKAEKILIDQLMRLSKIKNIKFEWNSTLEEIIGNDKNGVTNIKIKNDNNIIKNCNVDGVFIAIGYSPNTQLFNDQLEMINGYIKVQSGLYGNYTQTSIKGVFASGDVIDQVYKQAITSSATGCMAALDAEKYLDSLLNFNK